MQIISQQSLKAFNSFAVDATSRYFAEIKQPEDVNALLEWRATHEQASLLLLGGGSNLLFTQDFSGLTALINLQGKSLIDEDHHAYYVQAAAGENWHDFVCWTINEGYAGLENLSLIPGTVGAAPIQNIGAYGVELKDRFHCLQAIDLQSGEEKTFSLDACEFAYRDSLFKSKLGRYLITSVTFCLPKQAAWKTDYAGIREALAGKALSSQSISEAVIAIRQSKLPSPTQLGNAGSFFKNPILTKHDWEKLKNDFEQLPGYLQTDGEHYKTSAAWLIDQCGWKGKQQAGAGVYEKHALILTNATGKASGEAIWSLAQTIMQSVFDKYGVQLEPEPRIL